MNILKLVYYTGGTGTEMTFDHNEVRDMVINTKQDYSIKNLQNRKPLLYLTSGEYRTFTITINTFYPDTITKLNTLKSQTLPITLLYDYKNVPGSSACVMLDLKIPNYYSMGFWASGKDIQLIFYEVQPSLDYITIPESNIVCSTPNYALSLNGTDQYAYHAHNAIYNLAGEDCMLSAWIKTSDTEAYILSKQKTGTNGYALYVNASGVIGLVDGGGNFCSSGVTVNTALGKYISAVLDVSALKCYWFINGAYVTNVSYVALVDNTVDFVIGAMRTTGDSTGASGFLNGHIDEVRIYKFGVNGLYVTGTFGASGIIRAYNSTGSIIWLDSAPTTALIYKLYKENTYSLTNMGFSEIYNASQTNKFTNPDNEVAVANWGGTAPTAVRGAIALSNTQNHTSGGANSLKYTANGATGEKRFYWAKASFLSARWYRANCWVFIPTVNTVLVNIYLRYRNEDLSITYTNSPFNFTTIKNQWVNLFLNFYGSVNVSSYLLLSEGLNSGATSEVFYVDDLVIEELGEIPRYKFENDLLDENINDMDLTGVGTPTYTPHID